MKRHEMPNDGKYLRKENLPDDETVVVTVKSVKMVDLAKDGEPPKKKLAVLFYEYDKPLVLSAKINEDRAWDILGDDTEAWIGNRIAMYVNPDVTFGSDVVGGIRLKAPPRETTKATPRPSADDANRKLREAVADDDGPPF